MSVSVTLARAGRPAADRLPAESMRLAVAWQHPEHRRIVPVGLLSTDGESYQFSYLRRAAQEEGFRPFLGFPSFGRVYKAPRLFPLFAERVMSPERPDYGRFLDALDLDQEVTPWELLARSQGRREGDSVLVFPEPTVDAEGNSSTLFLVHGIRHALRAGPGVEAALMRLQPGDPLRLVDQPDNPHNSRAILVSESDGIALGWVPDLLLDYVHHLRSSGDVTVAVRHVNGPQVPAHLRLLANVAGQVEADYRAFDGPQWATFADGQEV